MSYVLNFSISLSIALSFDITYSGARVDIIYGGARVDITYLD